MTATPSQVEYQIERIRALVPMGEDIRAYVAQALDVQIASVAAQTPMGIVPASFLPATKVYASARVTAESIDHPYKVAARPEGIVDLVTIEWILRPAIMCEAGRLAKLVSGPWTNLAPDLVQRIEKSVCRIDLVVEGYAPVHVGTGFIGGEDESGAIVMTNAHVVDEALRLGWPFQSSLVLACDFGRYSVDSDGDLFAVNNEYQIHPQYDLALLHLPQEERTKVAALELSGSAPNPTIGLTIGVLGHPSFNASIDSFPAYFGFGDQFGVKRLSPGYIRKLEERHWRRHDVAVFLHDATTLSGSSGSCILDLSSMRVIGLHFGGWPARKQSFKIGETLSIAELFHANGAVPLWTLKDDPLLANLSFS
jgi:hypothetical protein